MKIYLDNNTLTPVDKQVFEAMEPLLKEPYGDLHSSHLFGAKTRKLYNEAVEKIYAFLHSKDSDTITFTSGASEANSTLFMSIYFDFILSGRKNSIIISEREPLSILQLADFLESQGCKVHRLPITKEGVVDPESLYDYITPRTALVSVTMVDPESGAINPIEEIGQICKKYDVPLHSDATFAVGKIAIDVQELKIDYISFSSKLLHAPAGTGVLWMKGGKEINPLIQGTRYPTQMFRGGSLNLSGIVALGKAVEIASDALDFEMEDVRELRDSLEEELTKIDGVKSLISWSLRVPNTLLLTVKGVEAESLLYHLNRDGIAGFSHAINPCGEWERQNLIDALELEPTLKRCVVGFALSRANTEEEIEKTVSSFKEVVEFLRENSPIKLGEENE
jgi:cysteine desulfurase